MNKPKLCVECRWYTKSCAESSPLDSPPRLHMVHSCTHEKGTKLNLITGEKRYRACSDMREEFHWRGDVVQAGCGPEGKLWEPKS